MKNPYADMVKPVESGPDLDSVKIAPYSPQEKRRDVVENILIILCVLPLCTFFIKTQSIIVIYFKIFFLLLFVMLLAKRLVRIIQFKMEMNSKQKP